MVGVKDASDIRAILQFIETQCEQTCAPVELRGKLYGSQRGKPLRLVFDIEPCLTFFYGGFSSDWASGGQWNHTLRFLKYLVQTCAYHNIEICVYFNGASERERYLEWVENQSSYTKRAHDIVRFINTKAFHPPKGLWVAPAGVRSVLRLALQKLGVPTAASYKDHRLEIMSFIGENNFDGFVTWDADLIMFCPSQRFFSAQKLFLSYNGILTATEFSVDDFAKAIDLDPSRFGIMATLLGTHLMPAELLQDFYCRICRLSTPVHLPQFPATAKISAVIEFVRELPAVDDMNTVVQAVFGSASVKVEILESFQKSVEYFSIGSRGDAILDDSPYSSYNPAVTSSSSQTLTAASCDNSQLLGDDMERVVKSCSAMSVGETNVTHQNEQGSAGGWDDDFHPKSDSKKLPSNGVVARGIVDYSAYLAFGKSGYSSSSSLSFGKGLGYSCPSAALNPLSAPLVKWWKVDPKILSVAKERHQRAMMMPWIYQILVHGEIFFPKFVEDEADQRLTTAIDLFRPLRQRVYAILLERDSAKISDSDAIVREWSVSARPTPLPKYSTVLVPRPPKPLMLPRMWFGTSDNDIVLRIHSFLDLFGCRPIEAQLLNPSNVKPQYLILCCVLRYMLIQKSSVIVDEDAVRGFLATAVSSRLNNSKAIKELNIPVMSMSSIRLATLFMHGFENALFANEAFGSPLPIDLFCPSQYFDGKLFHYKMAKINQKASLADVCENSLEQQLFFEKLQTALLSSLPNDCGFTKPSVWNSLMSHGSKGMASQTFGRQPEKLGPHGRSQDVEIEPKWRAPFANEKMFFRPAGASRSMPVSLEGRICPLMSFPSGANGVPFPGQRHQLTVLETPPRRNLRPDVRTRHLGGRGKPSRKQNESDTSRNTPANETNSRPDHSFRVNAVSVVRSKRGAIGNQSQHNASKRGAIGNQSQHVRPVAAGYGRGRGCTVEIELTNRDDDSKASPVISAAQNIPSRIIGRGRSASFFGPDLKLGQHQLQLLAKSSPLVESEEMELGFKKSVQDADQFEDANVSNTLCVDRVADTRDDVDSVHSDDVTAESFGDYAAEYLCADDVADCLLVDAEASGEGEGVALPEETCADEAEFSDKAGANGESASWGELMEAEETGFASSSLDDNTPQELKSS